MVAEPTVTPSPARSETASGRLIEASFLLWRRSWVATFGFALLYGIASLLPGVALSGLMRDVLMHALAVTAELAQVTPTWLRMLPSADPVALFENVLAQLRDPVLWLVLAGSVVVIVFATTALIVRQAGIAGGSDPGLRGALQTGLRRTPATLLAWLVYTVIVGATAIPFLVLTLGALWVSVGASPSVALLMLGVIFIGGLLSSIPLAWASVAFGFAPFVTAIEARGALHAQGRSLRLVRGHWWRCAVVVSMPLLIYIGINSTLSSVLMLLCGGVAYLSGGWVALFDPGWLFWSQVLALPVQAAALPLAFAGGVVMFDDLRLRAAPAA